jgi:hypothetical protein
MHLVENLSQIACAKAHCKVRFKGLGILIFIENRLFWSLIIQVVRNADSAFRSLKWIIKLQKSNI